MLTAVADRVHHLQAFVDDVVGTSCVPQGSEVSSLGTQTFQAFADSLARILRDFRAHLSHLERKAAEQGEFFFDSYQCLRTLDSCPFSLADCVFCLMSFLWPSRGFALSSKTYLPRVVLFL